MDKELAKLLKQLECELIYHQDKWDYNSVNYMSKEEKQICGTSAYKLRQKLTEFIKDRELEL